MVEQLVQVTTACAEAGWSGSANNPSAAVAANNSFFIAALLLEGNGKTGRPAPDWESGSNWRVAAHSGQRPAAEWCWRRRHHLSRLLGRGRYRLQNLGSRPAKRATGAG